MKVVVTKNLNVRVGTPSVNAPCFKYVPQGSEIEVDGKLYKGDLYDDIDTWLKDLTGNYYWSGGVKYGYKEKNSNVDPTLNLINYNNIILKIPYDWSATNGHGVNIAILDTGINISHKDFNGIFNQGNALNFTSSLSGVKDVYNHGTQITGIIGARTSTTNGIRGVAPACNLFALKVGEDNGDFLDINIINALNWATSNDIHLINMSFSINYQRYQNVLKTLNNIRNCIIVAAAGENEILTKSNFFYPSMHPQIISVGAINQSINGAFNGKLNYMMPLLPIASCSGNDQILYKTDSGSSMSAALLTGAIALYLSYVNKNFLQKADIMQELDKYIFNYHNNMELGRLLIIKP
jgi:subtilisin family serine protease